ncbi:MAG: dual specificity protein phosphatase family protein [Aquificae bacterium]|nr:dual specificity protein phosphatase family protein [Aquificota bacterium]
MIRWIEDFLGGSRAPEPQELKEWKENNINTVINLLGGEYGNFIAKKQKEEGFEVIRIPFSMADPIPEEEFLAVYEYIDQLKKEGKKVVVHCKYGQARSGTFLAGYLIYSGVPYDEALHTVMQRGFYPHTDYQIQFLRKLAQKNTLKR